MPRGRHSLESTKNRRRLLSLLTIPLVAALAVGTGLLISGSARTDVPATASQSASQTITGAGTPPSAAPSPSAERTLGTSRSAARVPLVDNRVPKPTGKLWTTENLDLRLEPREKAEVAGLLKVGKQVPVTGRRERGYAEVVIGGTARWVTDDYLSKQKVAAAAAVSDQPCPDGSSIESGLQPAAVRTYRAVCNAFPELSAYGGQDGHGEHVNGQAIDFMVPSSSVGQRVADYLYAHHSEFDLFDIIWSQHIWTIERSGEGFRSMSDRGSATANHYDHVHIMVN